jgi:hypothetical protein
MFQDFFHFIGVYLLLCLFVAFFTLMWDSLTTVFIEIFKKEKNYFYISEKNVDKKFLEELKKYSSKACERKD